MLSWTECSNDGFQLVNFKLDITIKFIYTGSKSCNDPSFIKIKASNGSFTNTCTNH